MGPVPGQDMAVHSPFRTKHHPSLKEGDLSDIVENTEVYIRAAGIDEGGEYILVSFSAGDGRCRFPAVFLRYNCLCSECFDHSARANKILVSDVNPEVKVIELEVSKSNKWFTLTWDDGHKSTYGSEWLYARRFTQEGRQDRGKWYRRKPELWGAETMKNVPTDTFENILNDDMALYNWISTLEKLGLFLITGAPQEVGQIERLSARVAYLRLNNYGKTFQVKSKPNPTNLAYTNAPIGMHTDLPYYDYVPGMQMLHCIKQADGRGGENGFADGFRAAQQLKIKHPEYYLLLTLVKLDYWDIGEDEHKFYMIDSKPVIRLNEAGEVMQINYNPQTLDSFMSLPAEQVKSVYKAIKTFNDLIYAEANIVNVTMASGDIACFHNYRVLHSRSGFTTTGSSQRHLEGGYLDWDELCSRRRVLQLEYGLSE